MKRIELEKMLNEKIALFLEHIDKIRPPENLYLEINDKVFFNKHYNRLEWKWRTYTGLSAEIKLMIDTFIPPFYGIYAEGYDSEYIILYWDCEKE